MPRQIIDQNSATLSEIAFELGCGKTRALKLVQHKVNSGLWERVSKRIGGYDKPVPSYRIKVNGLYDPARME